MTDYGFIRVSTGSQDAQTQERDILRAHPGAIIVRTATRAASASKGEQLDALDALISKLKPSDRVIITDSSRIDRRENITSQVETMLAIRNTGASIVSLAPGEETFASGDDLGSWITTLVKQNANAEKSRTVKTQTARGISQIRDNRAHHGPLPLYWKTHGPRYGKLAYCENPEAVTDIYTRVANGESLQSIVKDHDLYAQSIRNLIRFEANHTGVIQCSYTHNDVTDQWSYGVKAVVDSALWHRANAVLDANQKGARTNRGGRPAFNWLSGLLDCPFCGGKLFVSSGTTGGVTKTGKKRPNRTPRLRCAGDLKKRLTCGEFKPCDAQSVMLDLDELFSDDTNPILRFDRVAGNTHELDALKAELSKLQAQLSTITDRGARREAVARIETTEDRIDAFEVIPDRFDYTPTGKTLGDMWREASDKGKRDMVKAVKAAWGIALTQGPRGAWGVRILPPKHPGSAGDIVDLGGGMCFRRKVALGPVIRDLTDAME